MFGMSCYAVFYSFEDAYEFNYGKNKEEKVKVLCKYIVYFSILTPTKCANIFGGYNKTHFIYKSYSIA